ncbi:mechanosensitive ion channel family protein [Halopseudomonas laoshanensis]|uniref:mechanosensitive ion channel family protein n=1 Tax=Halopseudomonas laoshanensis TaxID=2268758 RepID=UPI003734E953
MPTEWSAMLFTPEIQLLLRACVAVLVLGLAAKIVGTILSRVTSRFSYLHQLVENLSQPLVYLLPLLGLQATWLGAPEGIPFMRGIQHLTSLATIAVITWIGIRAVQSVQQTIIAHNPVDVADNLKARQIQTQTRLLVRTMSFFVLLFGVASMLTTFPAVRQVGTGLMASAGLAGLAVGFAAKPVLGNIIAGLQIAITQPIRIDDVVIVENEWGRVEEITGTYVVIRIWDDRRLVVPLQYFIEQPFQNWTRHNASITGSVFFWADYTIPLKPLREEMDRLLDQVPELWDGRVKVLQVTDTTDKVMQLRVLASSGDSGSNWDLRCYLREHLIGFISREYPECLPQLRATLESPAGSEVTATPPEQSPSA